MRTEWNFTDRVPPQSLPQPEAAEAPPSLERIARILRLRPFKPHPMFSSGHAQTLVGFYWPRRLSMRAHRADEQRLFEVEPGARLLAHCRWQQERNLHPTMLLVHGLEGSSTSVYMLGTAEKAFRTGFNVVRLNLRNCGDTEHLAPTLYHAGMSSDLDAVIRELVEKDNLPSIFLAGFSMGGNMTLKLAGEEPGRLPRQLVAVCAVSPSIDLSLCADAIEQRSNWVYKRSFIQSLHRRIRQKQKLFPDLYDTRDLRLVRTIRAFDERYTAIHGGYSDADDYYSHASALPFLPRIAIPSLIVHAIDDPFVPYEPLRDPAIKSNPNIVLLSPEHGGHVGFVGVETQGEDRFWVENRIVEFCQLVRELLAV